MAALEAEAASIFLKIQPGENRALQSMPPSSEEFVPLPASDYQEVCNLKTVEEKLEKVSGALCNLEKEVFGGSKDKKPIISETQLEDHLLEGISSYD